MTDHSARCVRGEGTRERLLRAAERVFADKGYRAATVREITEAAGANVAAVNYHFGGKHDLYLELFRDRIESMAAIRQAARAQARGGDPVEDLRRVTAAFVRSWFGLMLGEEREGRGRFPTLVMREIGDPGPAYPVLLDRLIRPTHEMFQGLILRAHPDLGPDRATLCAASLLGQVIHFVRARRVLETLLGRECDEAMAERICEHVVSFTLGGVGVTP
ncbi:CerR family C-terminal domain-containing protein [Deferrisoma camini]|uniref:CerR family C-terminal domain-containing protein n=1 Tax=Deferrisoma camini TaxID=1035120 RepID=UPI00046D2EF7|nr:CerR family C-terminal domain-containing protein [Deferrisoma camini]